MNRVHTLLSLLLLSISPSLSAQLVLDNSVTPEDYVQQTLLGDGVQAFNVTFNGDPGNLINVQCGGFDNGDETNLGLNRGVILASGFTTDAAGPNNTGSVGGFPGVPFPVDGDPDLEIIADGFTINDIAILEFDFIPLGDTLRFNYVFASDEYPEFANGSFNDAFGFFLSGPGITGPFSSPAGFPGGSANIALIPDTDIPVTINNLNNGTDGLAGPCEFCEFYNHNGTGFEEPFASDDFYIQYDGFTTVLEAFALVECGETYHIKLAIADAGDSSYDSAVFLQENSFESPPSGLAVESLFPEGLVEISDQCDTAFATIGRPCDSDTTWYLLNFLEGDTLAILGEDFVISDTAFILPTGVRDTTLAINTIADGIEEGTEWLCIELFESVDGINYESIDTACVPIIDQYTFPVDVNDVTLFCPEDIPTLFATPQSPGFGPFEYFWSINGVDTLGSESIFVGERPEGFLDSITYTLQVTDFCGAVNDPTNTIVINQTPGPTELTMESVQQYCPGLPFTPAFDRSGGTAPFTYTYQVNQFPPVTSTEPDEDLSDLLLGLYFGEEDGAWVKLTVSDNCDPARFDTDSVFVTFPTPIEVDLSFSFLVCEDQVLDIEYTVTGGYPPYDLSWGIDPNDAFFVFDTVNGELEVTAVNFNDFNVDDPEEESFYFITLEANDFCSAQSLQVQSGMDTDTVIAKDCFIPNVVTSNGDDLNDSFVVLEMVNRPGTLSVFNRWGNVLYEGNRNIWTPDQEPEGTYFYIVQFEDGGNEKGSFTILR